MSVRAMTWVWDLALPTSQKLVLLALADRSTEEGLAWPGIQEVCHKCNLSKRSLIYILQKLEQGGFITRHKRYAHNGHRSSNIYQLNMSGMVAPSLSANIAPSIELSANIAPRLSAKSNRLSATGCTNIRTIIEPPDNNNINTASDSDESVAQDSFYLTKKKRKLAGKRLETFNRFWQAFAYARGKAEAADSWMDIPQMTMKMVDQICAAAEREATNRPALMASGRTPKMAQGWLAGRRWEDEVIAEPSQPGKTPTKSALKALMDGAV